MATPPMPTTDPSPYVAEELTGVALLPGGEPPLERPTLARGTSIGRYLTLEVLGEGGLGIVYAAYDPELDRRVAIKLVRPDAAPDGAMGEHADRLLREAQAMARLSHPNVVTVHDVGRLGDQVFIAMELVDGISLANWMRQTHHWNETRDVFIEAGRGLVAAHAAGLVHRDFKPSNVLLELDPAGRVTRARVLDFGLARGITRTAASQQALAASLSQSSRRMLESDLTQEGMVMGTPLFMAPEALGGREVDPASDQFSFCVALWMALFGRRPFGVADVPTLLLRMKHGEFDESDRSKRVPSWLVRVLKRGLSFSPQQRFPSMEALLHALESDKRTRRRGGWAIATAAVLALGGGTAAYVLLPPPVAADTRTRIDELTEAARTAAGRQYYVYPPANDDEGDTAYQRVLELEALKSRAARRRATELRDEFADALIRLGDQLYDRPHGRPFAVDFYASALVFRPDDAHARDRTTLTAGEQADLRERAGNLDFTEAQLTAAESLAVLADPDETSQKRRLAKLERKSSIAATTSTRLHRVLRRDRAKRSSSDGLTVADASVVPKEPSDNDLPAMAIDLELPDDDASMPIDTKLRGATTRRRDKRASKATPRVESPSIDEEIGAITDIGGGGRSDPVRARALAKRGQAALEGLQTKQAESLFHKALEFDRREPMALIGLTELYFEEGKYSKALTYAKRAVRRSPRSPTYRLWLGDAYFKTLAYKDARQQYERAQELGSGRAAGRLERLDKLLK